MLHRAIREDNFEHKQCCNIVSNGCNTVLTLQCFVVLKIGIADESIYPCNITFKPGGVCYLNESDTPYQTPFNCKCQNPIKHKTSQPIRTELCQMFCVWTNQKYIIPDFGLFTCDQVMVGALTGSLEKVVPLRSSNPDPI